jgi:hypothetical protein
LTGHGTGMSQLMVSLILHYLKKQGRVISRGKRGRGSRLQFFLARPFSATPDDIGRGIVETAARDREIVRMLREGLGRNLRNIGS